MSRYDSHMRLEKKYSPDQERDESGRFGSGSGSGITSHFAGSKADAMKKAQQMRANGIMATVAQKPVAGRTSARPQRGEKYHVITSNGPVNIVDHTLWSNIK